MIQKNKKTLILTSIITLLPMVVGLLLWNKLPETMATHFGADNDPNGFNSKAFVVFAIPSMLLALQLFCAFITSKDPRQKNISDKIYRLVLWIVPCMSLFAMSITYLYNMNVAFDISRYAGLFVGILFVIVGNFLPKARQNYTIGIKLPWTLANEENWNKTHRLAGTVWVIAGILLIITTFLNISKSDYVLFGIIMLAGIIPSIYSFFLHTKKGL